MIRAINDNLVVEPYIEKKTKGGMVFIEKYMPKARKGKVLSAGKKCKYVKEGDVIKMAPHEAREVTIEGKLYYIVEENQVVGLFVNDKE